MSDQNYFLSTNIVGDFNDPTIDNSGYGALPAAEKNQIYFAYFTSVGSTTPEIIDQTSYFIKYLIDSQGNVVAPQPNSIDILNMVQNFEPSKLVNVTSLEGTTLFSPLLGTKQITDVGKIETLLVSQTGSGVLDASPFIDFVSTVALYTYSDYDFSFLVRKSLDQNFATSYSLVNFQTVTLDPEGRFTPTAGDYYYEFAENTVTANNPISFKVQLSSHPGSMVNNTNGNSYQCAATINIQIKSSSVANPNVYDHILAEKQFYISPVDGQISLSYNQILSTPFLNFAIGSRVRVYAKASQQTPPGFTLNSSARMQASPNTYFTLTPQYLFNIRATLPYFTTGSADSLYLTASTSINNAYYSNMIAKAPTASLNPPMGFSNITNQFLPQSGDYIRFEYNPLKTYKIYEVVENGDENVVFRLNKGILEGTNINNFVIYRVNPNAGNQIILDVQKPSGTTGDPLTGFIKPQHITKELEDNFTTIIQKLAAEGTI